MSSRVYWDGSGVLNRGFVAALKAGDRLYMVYDEETAGFGCIEILMFFDEKYKTIKNTAAVLHSELKELSRPLTDAEKYNVERNGEWLQPKEIVSV